MSTNKNQDTKKPDNDIRVGMKSRPRYVIKYAQSIMKEKKFNELKFSAIGGSIGRLIEIVEVLKILIPDLYQQNRITSVAYQTVDSNNQLLNQRLYPKLEVILSTEEFKNKNEGTQDKWKEEDRKFLEDYMNKRKVERERNRGRGRRGGFRGRRGGFRGRRPGFRGIRRGFRGRGGPRRGTPQRGRGRPQRGQRGGQRGGQKGGQRGGPKVNKGRGK